MTSIMVAPSIVGSATIKIGSTSSRPSTLSILSGRRLALSGNDAMTGWNYRPPGHIFTERLGAQACLSVAVFVAGTLLPLGRQDTLAGVFHAFPQGHHSSAA